MNIMMGGGEAKAKVYRLWRDDKHSFLPHSSGADERRFVRLDGLKLIEKRFFVLCNPLFFFVFASHTIFLSSVYEPLYQHHDFVFYLPSNPARRTFLVWVFLLLLFRTSKTTGSHFHLYRHRISIHA